MPIVNRRAATDHDTVRMVIWFLGIGATVLTICVGVAYFVAVASACRGNAQATAALQGLNPVVASALGTAITGLAALLSNTKRDTPPPADPLHGVTLNATSGDGQPATATATTEPQGEEEAKP